MPVCVAGRDRRWSGCRTPGTGAAAVAAETGSPRIGLVFALGQCDKKNQGWREGPPLFNALPRFDSDVGLHPPQKLSCRTKKEYRFPTARARLRSNADDGKGRQSLICLSEAELDVPTSRPNDFTQMKSTLKTSDYPRAWAEYKNRWRAAWAIPLLLLGCYIATGILNTGKPLTWVLVAAFLAYVVLYIRFLRWPCPRCGHPFTVATPRGVFRASKCTYCGLPLNYTSSSM